MLHRMCLMYMCFHASFNKLARRYDEEIARLHRELEARGGPPQPAHIGGPPHNAGPAQPQPPAIGHGTNSLFSGLMGPGGQGAPGLAPPTQDQQQPPQQHQMPPAPPNLPQGPPQAPQPPFQGYQSTPAVNGMNFYCISAF